MKYKIKNKKNNIYYSSTIFKNQYHWSYDKPYLFKSKREALNKIDEIVAIKKIDKEDLEIEVEK